MPTPTRQRPQRDPFEVLRRSERTSSTNATQNSTTTNARISRVKRKLTLTLDGKPNGNYAYTWDYPDGEFTNHYKTPLYTLRISNGIHTKAFQVIRFGPRYVRNEGYSVAGLADHQTHSLTWYPEYKLHSTDTAENGAWIVYGNFLIHDGPDTNNPNRADSMIGTAGCLEVFGPNGFSNFNRVLRELGGVTSNKDVDTKITYLKAIRPVIRGRTLVIP